MSGFYKDFLWGGAIAASQADGAWNEGGSRPGRRNIIPSGAELIFTTIIKKIWH